MFFRRIKDEGRIVMKEKLRIEKEKKMEKGGKEERMRGRGKKM